MAFDIPNLHIDNESPEGRVIETIMLRDHVSAAEAARRAIRHAAPILDNQEHFLAAVREGIADIEAGRFQNLDDAFAEIWSELDAPETSKVNV